MKIKIKQKEYIKGNNQELDVEETVKVSKLLKEEIEKTTDTYLKTKLKDMTLIYEQFENKICDSYIEETDMLDLLVTNLEKTDLVKDSVIYIDGDDSFDYEKLSKKYKRYTYKIEVKIMEHHFLIKIDVIDTKNKFFKDKIYFIIDNLEILTDKIGDILVG